MNVELILSREYTFTNFNNKLLGMSNNFLYCTNTYSSINVLDVINPTTLESIAYLAIAHGTPCINSNDYFAYIKYDAGNHYLSIDYFNGTSFSTIQSQIILNPSSVGGYQQIAFNGEWAVTSYPYTSGSVVEGRLLTLNADDGTYYDNSFGDYYHFHSLFFISNYLVIIVDDNNLTYQLRSYSINSNGSLTLEDQVVLYGNPSSPNAYSYADISYDGTYMYFLDWETPGGYLPYIQKYSFDGTFTYIGHIPGAEIFLGGNAYGKAYLTHKNSLVFPSSPQISNIPMSFYMFSGLHAQSQYNDHRTSYDVPNFYRMYCDALEGDCFITLDYDQYLIEATGYLRKWRIISSSDRFQARLII